MANAFAEVLEISQEDKVDMRTTAYVLSIRQVAKAIATQRLITQSAVHKVTQQANLGSINVFQ